MPRMKSEGRGKADASRMSKMNMYRVFMSVEPGVVLATPKTFKMNQGEIHFENKLHPKLKVPNGLRIRATLHSQDIETAMSRSRGLTNRVLALFSFLTNASLPDLLITLAYEVTPGKKRGDFYQSIYNLPLEMVSARPIDNDALNKSVAAISTLTEKENDNVFRALHWYRLALQSTDVVERFTLLWIGLETINLNLQIYYYLDVEFSKCACGRKKSPILNGVKQLFIELEGDRASWSKKTGLRAGILHGFKALKEVTPEGREMIPLLEKALRTGLDHILGLKEDRPPITANQANARPFVYTTTAIVEGPDLQLVDSERIPNFICDLQILESENKGLGHKVVFKADIDSRFVFKNPQHVFNVHHQIAERMSFETTPLE